MAAIWTDLKGQVWELKSDKGKSWHRRQGEGEDKWKEGPPPGWIEKSRIPLDQR